MFKCFFQVKYLSNGQLEISNTSNLHSKNELDQHFACFEVDEAIFSDLTEFKQIFEMKEEEMTQVFSKINEKISKLSKHKKGLELFVILTAQFYNYF